jgi:DNA mismatch repair protein MutL
VSEKPHLATRVRRLPDALVDQIAAGEVVERPASVVKELVENALDAGAARVRVDLRDGGAALVAVSDDGTGMGPEDARLALERHATSKLRSADDLRAIASFGFRGEALPAIASVSRLRLRTRPAEAAEGIEIVVDHGRQVLERAAGGAAGTRIEVADLFSGVPARRKFLKRPATEWSHSAEWLVRAALVRPDVHFDVVRDGKSAFVWPAVADPRERIAAALSEREAEAMLPVECERAEFRVSGFASRPDVHRRTAAGLYLAVNGRPVRDRLLRHALVEVYRDWLPRGRFPTAVLELSVPPDAVDVNVHPAKWEVRFVDPRAVHSVLFTALRTAIETRGWLGGASSAAPLAGGPSRGGSWAEPSAFSPRSRSERHTEPAPGDWLLAERPEPERDPAAAGAPAPFRFSDLRVVGQLLTTYLLVEDKHGLLLVDQHAAHERVLYEQLRAAWIEGGVDRQPLLVPTTVELEPAQAAVLAAEQRALEPLGFEVEAFDANTALVRAVPALLAGRDPAALLRGLADELAAGASLGSAASGGAFDASAVRHIEAADRVFASMACHSARRAGDALDPREQRALLDSLDTIPWAPTCPHGRPVAVPMSLVEIERRFGR